MLKNVRRIKGVTKLIVTIAKIIWLSARANLVTTEYTIPMIKKGVPTTKKTTDKPIEIRPSCNSVLFFKQVKQNLLSI